MSMCTDILVEETNQRQVPYNTENLNKHEHCGVRWNKLFRHKKFNFYKLNKKCEPVILVVRFQCSLFLKFVLHLQQWSRWRYIMLTSPYNVYPLTPHFYIVKLGFTEVYIISYFCSKT